MVVQVSSLTNVTSLGTCILTTHEFPENDMTYPPSQKFSDSLSTVAREILERNEETLVWI